MEADGTRQIRVTQAGVCRAPAWAPEGAQLAYLSAQTGSFEVWVTELSNLEEGKLQHRQVTRAAIDPTSGLSWGC
jgi:Tol biopolymer transport system component